MIYKKVVNYDEDNTNTPVIDKTNIDEHLMNNKRDQVTQKDTGTLIKNYANYDLDHQNQPKEIKKKILKSRLKRYNDPNDHPLEETYDKNYSYEYKPKETLSPLKHPDSIYNNLYTGLKSHLNWEKQFKCLDQLRKIIYYEPKLLSKDTYMTNLIIEEVLNLTSSIRSLLVKNALLTLSELFQIETTNILSSKYEALFKVVIKKIMDKNEFISKEAEKALDQYLDYLIFVRLVLNCDIVKASTVVVDTLTKMTFKENLLINMNILTKMIYFHDNNFIQHKNFNKSMNYVTDIFHKHKNEASFRGSIKDYFVALNKYFKDEEKFEKFLKNYYGYETLNKILHIINE